MGWSLYSQPKYRELQNDCREAPQFTSVHYELLLLWPKIKAQKKTFQRFFLVLFTFVRLFSLCLPASFGCLAAAANLYISIECCLLCVRVIG